MTCYIHLVQRDEVFLHFLVDVRCFHWRVKFETLVSGLRRFGFLEGGVMLYL